MCIKYFYVAKCVWHLAENNNCRNTFRFKCHNELYRLHDHCQTQTVCQICFAKRLASWEGIGYCHSLFQMPRPRKQSPPPPNLSTRPKHSRRLTQKARSALTDEEPVSQPPNPQIINSFPVPDNVEPLLPQQSGETSRTSTNSDPLLVALLEEVRRQGRAIQALQTQTERAASAHCAPTRSSWAAPRSSGHPECAAGTAHTSGGATIISSSGHCEYPDHCGCTLGARAAIVNNPGHSKCTTSGASVTSGQGLRCDRRGPRA